MSCNKITYLHVAPQTHSLATECRLGFNHRLSTLACCSWAGHNITSTYSGPSMEVTWLMKISHKYLLGTKKKKKKWRAPQVAVVIKSLPASAGDERDAGSILGSGRSPGGGHGNPLQYSCLRTPWTEEPGGLQSTGSQRVGHDWSYLAWMQKTERRTCRPVNIKMKKSWFLPSRNLDSSQR